ncbi:MAG: glycosyltransferase [Candidatus Palauibacterales bacterium]|nr:glycosyltransferase [Candidatus Palauibacterales bacterium]
MTRPLLRVLHVESGHEWRLTRNQVRLLVDGLRRVPGVDQTVATLARSRLERAARDMGIPVVSLPWSVGADPRALRTLARQVRRHWDIVHAHDTHALRLMAYLAALEGSRSAIVASRRTVQPPRSAWKWRRADLVLAVSESARQSLVDGGVERTRVIVVPEGVDTVGLEPPRPGALRAAAGAEPGHFFIASLAALGPDRDHATLLRAASLVVRAYPNARFAIFGEGPERGRLESLIDVLGLEGRVCLPGYVENARLSLADIDLFLMPSQREELSTGCLEAMWAGVPVLMTASGDGRLRAEGIEPVRPADHAEMATAIGRFIEDAEYRRLTGEKARRYARAHPAEEMVRATLEAYDAVSRRGCGAR